MLEIKTVPLGQPHAIFLKEDRFPEVGAGYGVFLFITLIVLSEKGQAVGQRSLGPLF